MNPSDQKQSEILEDLKVKIRTVIERVGVTDMAVEIVIDLVARGLGRMGGRPPDPKPGPNGLPTGSERVPNPPRGASESSSDLDLFSGDPRSPSEQSEGSKKVMSPKAGALVKAKKPFQPALAAFCTAWEARYGVKYILANGELNQLGKALERVPVDADFPAIFGRYLADLSPFIAQDVRHGLMWFCTKGNGFNKYRTTAPILSAKEARNHAAGNQWLDLHNQGGGNGVGRK